MGFSTEELNLLSFTNRTDNLKLVNVSDTVRPITPQRVEEVVPVQQTPIQTKQEGTEQSVIQLENEALQLEEAHARESERHEVIPVQTRVDTLSTVPAIASVAPIPIVPIQPEQPPAINNAVAPEVTSTPSLTAIYPLEVDTMAIDTVVVTEVREVAKGMSSFSLDAQKEGKNLPAKLDRSDGVFLLLLVCFLLLAHVYRGGILFFKENIMLVFSASKSEKLEDQSTTKEIFYSFFLVFLAVLLISVSLYEALDRFMPLSEEEKRPFATVGLFVSLILIFIFLKINLNKLIGYIFDYEKRINTWNQSYVVLLSLLGLLCFFPILMLIYSSLWHSIIIGFVMFLFLIVQIILLIRITVFFIEQKFNFLYLIAYLCAVEILPYIFLGIGLVSLYKIDVFNTVL